MAHTILLAATTAWPSAARLAAGFAELGWRVEVMAPWHAPVRKSRFVATAHRYHALAPHSCLMAAIARSGADLIVPCDDRAVSQLLALHAEAHETGKCGAAALITRSLGAPGNYAVMRMRAAFIAEAQAAGISVPRTRSIEREKDLEEGLSAIGLPAVLKSDGSWGGDGVAIVHTREEARAAFRRMSRPLSRLRGAARAFNRGDMHHLADALRPLQPVLSLQEFIPGTPATTSFACWRGEVLAAIHMDVAVSQGGTGPASVVRRIGDPAMDSAARKLARRFGLSGLHGLDFIRDAGGAAHLLEINLRAPQTAALALGEGRDLLAALAAQAAGGAVSARPPATSADLIALFPQEWLRDPESPHLATAYHDVPWNDPAVLRLCLHKTAHARKRTWMTRLRLASNRASVAPVLSRPYRLTGG